MNQLTIFDFVEDEQIADSVILNRIQSAFPGWEAIGYTKTYEWNWKDGKQEDYSAIIRRNDEYLWVHVWLYADGRTQAGYVQRSDFEPHWFERYEKQGERWIWRSLDDRNRVFEIARQNMG
jgi:hypothetical protein